MPVKPSNTSRVGRTRQLGAPRNAGSARQGSTAQRVGSTMHVEATRPPGSMRSREHPEPWRGPGREPDVFRATLRGDHQVPPVFTPGSGTFRARITDGGTALQYELDYSNLSTDSLAAHIHFGHPTDNGGIIAFLCGGDDKPTCPPREGTVRGTIEAEDILAIPEQGLEAGDMEAALAIIRAGLAYVNVHTIAFPDGEIRGQIRPGQDMG